MTLLRPSAFDYRPASDSGRVALGRAIDESGEVADFIERANFLYAAAARMPLYSAAWPSPLKMNAGTTTTTSPYSYVLIGKDQDDFTLKGRGQNGTLVFSIYDTSFALEDSATLTFGASVSTQVDTLSINPLTEGYVRWTWTRSSGDCLLYLMRCLPGILGVSELPS